MKLYEYVLKDLKISNLTKKELDNEGQSPVHLISAKFDDDDLFLLFEVESLKDEHKSVGLTGEFKDMKYGYSVQLYFLKAKTVLGDAKLSDATLGKIIQKCDCKVYCNCPAFYWQGMAEDDVGTAKYPFQGTKGKHFWADKHAASGNYSKGVQICKHIECVRDWMMDTKNNQKVISKVSQKKESTEYKESLRTDLTSRDKTSGVRTAFSELAKNLTNADKDNIVKVYFMPSKVIKKGIDGKASVSEVSNLDAVILLHNDNILKLIANTKIKEAEEKKPEEKMPDNPFLANNAGVMVNKDDAKIAKAQKYAKDHDENYQKARDLVIGNWMSVLKTGALKNDGFSGIDNSINDTTEALKKFYDTLEYSYVGVSMKVDIKSNFVGDSAKVDKIVSKIEKVADDKFAEDMLVFYFQTLSFPGYKFSGNGGAHSSESRATISQDS